MPFEYGPLIAIAVIAALALIGLLPRRPEDELTAFRKDCRRQGLDFYETEAAIAIRLAFVQLRTQASDLCVAKEGLISRQDINRIAGGLAIGIAASHGNDAAKSFIGWIDTCPDEEILYDDARSMRHRRAQDDLRQIGQFPPKTVTIPVDLAAAFKVVKR